MTDLITRARKEWCEPPISETVLTHYGTKIIATPKGSSCPPSVVAALLDLREFIAATIITCRCVACEIRREQQLLDLIAAVDSAITRALEGKI